MTPTLTYPQLIALRPCEDARKRIEKLLGGKTKWNGKPITAAQAVAAGVSFDNLIWVASAVALTDKDVEHRLRLWIADCAARVLHLYEKQAPTDMRVRACIIAARQFARGEITAAAWAAAWAAARSAAWAAAGDAAWAAARSAAWAAAGASAWAAAGASAWAAAWTAAGAAAGNAEEKWQLDRLVAWLSDPEPTDWPLPEPQTITEQRP